MAGALRERLKVLGFAVETTAGVAENVTTALAEHIYGARMLPDSPFADGARTPQGHYDGGIDGVAGMQAGTLTFSINIRPGGQFLPLLVACGYVLNTGVYEPRSKLSLHKTATFALWEDGKKKLLHGCAGNCRITLRNGAAATAEFTYRGIWNTPTDVAMPALAPILAQPYVSNPFVVTLAAAGIPFASEAVIDLGATIAGRENIGKASGYEHFHVQSRQPTMTLDPEASLVATHNAFGLLMAGTSQAMEGTLTRGDFDLVISSALAQRQTVEPGDRNGKATEALNLWLLNSAGDDDLYFEEVDNS
jgi:hypothetical protein